MKIYWYAPFDNAFELAVAERLALPHDELTVHALATRFGKPLTDDHGLNIVRDLPEPAGESGPAATVASRGKVAFERARLRSKYLAKQHHDVIHVHTYNMFTDAVALRRLRKRCDKLILSVHNVRPHKQRGPRLAETLTHRLGYQACDHVIATHDLLRRQLVDEFGLAEDRTSTIPLAIQDVPTTNAPSASERRELLFFGTLRHNKGVDVLLDAVQHLPADLDISIRIAGRGESDIEGLVHSAAQRDRRIVPEIGWVTPERQHELYEQAWAVVLPYTSYAAQSGVLRDAYAYKAPVLASDTGALGRSVRDESSGWLVPPGDARALAGAIATSVTDITDRDQYVRNVGMLTDQRGFAAIARATRELYEQVTRR